MVTRNYRKPDKWNSSVDDFKGLKTEIDQNKWKFE